MSEAKAFDQYVRDSNGWQSEWQCKRKIPHGPMHSLERPHHSWNGKISFVPVGNIENENKIRNYLREP
jgi:hypothetical protein